MRSSLPGLFDILLLLRIGAYRSCRGRAVPHARSDVRRADAMLLSGPPGPMRALQVQTACREGDLVARTDPYLFHLCGSRPSSRHRQIASRPNAKAFALRTI